MADGNQQSGWSGFIGTGIQDLASYYGNKSATNALTGAEQGAINTQTGLQGQLTGIYDNQRILGNGSDNALGAQLGLYGRPDYSAFNNSPGYQFSLAQGNQAIDRTAAANGSLYTPNTLAMLSQYNTGYASQNYNNYISQLMQSAGLGAQGNSGLASNIYGTGSNISQLQQNQGNARAGGAANSTGIATNLLSKVPWGSVGNTVSNWYHGGSSSDPSGGGVSDYGAGSSDTTAGQYNGGSFGGGAPLYDPNTGGYPGAGSGDNSSGNIDWLNYQNPT